MPQAALEMKHTFLSYHQSKHLIVFFAGWGCDEHQFTYLRDTYYDVLICYDYQDLKLDFDWGPYQDITLIAYSAGVMVASLVMASIPRLRQKIAINGNPFLFDDKKGIPLRIRDVIAHINLDNYMDFRRDYMVYDEKEFELYNAYETQRSVESCAAEYAALQTIYQEHKTQLSSPFDAALFSDSDEMFDLAEQKLFYQNIITILPHSKHHLFFRFHSFEEILQSLPI